MFRAAFIALILQSTVAAAAPWEPKGADARRLLDEGRAAFKAGAYAQAAELFLQADGAEENLNAQWNAAQSHAAAGDWKSAGQLYDQLLADRTLPKERRQEVQGRQLVAARFIAAEYAGDAQKWDDARAQYVALLNDQTIGPRDRTTASMKLEALARARAEAETATRPPDQPDLEPGPPAPEVPSLVMPPPRAPSRWEDTSALVLTGAGLVALGVGVGFTVNANGLDDDANASTDQREVANLRDRADTRRTIGYVALGVGAAVTIAGVVKFVLVPSPRIRATATLAPTAGGATVMVGGFW